MHAKFIPECDKPLLLLSTHPITDADRGVEVMPLGPICGGNDPYVSVNIQKGLSRDELGDILQVLHIAHRIAAGETYIIMGDGALEVITEERKLWDRVREIEATLAHQQSEST